MVWREVFDLFRDCSFQTQEREMFVEYNLQPKLTVNQLVVQLVNFGNKNENNQGVPVHTHGVVFKHQSEELSCETGFFILLHPRYINARYNSYSREMIYLKYLIWKMNSIFIWLNSGIIMIYEAKLFHLRHQKTKLFEQEGDRAGYKDRYCNGS